MVGSEVKTDTWYVKITADFSYHGETSQSRELFPSWLPCSCDNPEGRLYQSKQNLTILYLDPRPAAPADEMTLGTLEHRRLRLELVRADLELRI